MLHFPIRRILILGVCLLVALMGMPRAAGVHAQGFQTTLLRNIPGGWVGRGIAVTPDGQRLYVPSSSTTIAAIDTNTFEQLASIIGCQNPTGIAITPTGSHVYVAGNCGGLGRVLVIRTSDNVVVKTLNAVNVSWGVAISPDGQFVYVTDDANGSNLVAVIRTSDNTIVGYYSGVGNRSRGIAVTPDGRYIYVTSFASSTISVIDTSVAQVIKTIAVSGGSLAGVSITPDGQYAYVANGTQLVIIRTSDHSLHTTIPLPSIASAIAFTPDGEYAYIGAGLLYVVRTSDRTIVKTLDTTGAGSWNDFAALAVSPTMSQVYVTNSQDGIISIFTYAATYSISGRVADGSGNGIADVTIATNTGSSTLTNNDGDYTIADLMAGNYTLTPSKEGFTFSPPSSPPITVSSDVQGVNFTSAPVPPPVPSLTLTVTAPATLSVVNNQYSPNPFDVVARVANNGAATAGNVQLTLNLPTGLSLAAGVATELIGDLDPGQEQQVVWSVQAAAQSSQTTLTYSITVEGANVDPKTIDYQITLPSIDIEPDRFIFAAPYNDRLIRTWHTKSPEPGSKQLLSKGFSVAIADADTNTGIFTSSVVVFGGTEKPFDVFDKKNSPAQESRTETAFVTEFTPQFNGDLLVETNLTINGEAGAAAGSGLAVSIDVVDEIGKALIDWLTGKEISKLLDILEALLKPTVAGAGIDVFLTVSGGASGEATQQLTGAGAAFPVPGPYNQNIQYNNQAVKLSTVVHVTKGQTIRIVAGTKTRAMTWGWASSFVNLKNSRVNSVVLTRQ